MAHMRHNPTKNQKGKVTYNTDIVNGIVSLAIGEVEGATLPDVKNKGIKLEFNEKGINADISVTVEHTCDISKLAYHIQQAIKNNVETMTNYKINKIDVHVIDVRFSDGQ